MKSEAVKDIEKLITSTVLSVDGDEEALTIRARSLAGKTREFLIAASTDGKLFVTEIPRK